MLLAHLFALALSAHDICSAPSFDPDAPQGKPFCIIEQEQKIETPFFVVTITPGVLVWLYDDGRTLAVESSVHQSRISFGVGVKELEEDEIPRTLQANGCPDVKIVPGVKTFCDRSAGDYVDKLCVILSGRRLITAGLSAGASAKSELANYESMFNSLVLAP